MESCPEQKNRDTKATRQRYSIVLELFMANGAYVWCGYRIPLLGKQTSAGYPTTNFSVANWISPETHTDPFPFPFFGGRVVCVGVAMDRAEVWTALPSPDDRHIHNKCKLETFTQSGYKLIRGRTVG